jgi:hypothetical protein
LGEGHTLVFIVIKEMSEHIILVVCDDEFHANGVEVIFKLSPIKTAFLVFIKLLENCEQLPLQLFVNHTLFELHRYF